MPLAAFSSPGYSPVDGQPAVCLCRAAIGLNVRICRGECCTWKHGLRSCLSGCWRYVHVEGEGLGVGVVVTGIAFQGERDGVPRVAYSVPGWTGTRPPAACTGSPRPPRPPASRSPGHIRICSVTLTSRPVAALALTCVWATCRSPPVTLIPERRCGRARSNPDRHPNYILAANMASGT
jgi:hypothetical protein